MSYDNTLGPPWLLMTEETVLGPCDAEHTRRMQLVQSLNARNCHVLSIGAIILAY
jgi:hypothetical protein